MLFGLGAESSLWNSESRLQSFRAYLSSQCSDNRAELAVASQIDHVSLAIPGLDQAVADVG